MDIISAIPEDKLKGDSTIQDAAEFAVEDYNQNNFCDVVQFCGIEKAAIQKFKSGSVVFYISVLLQPQHVSKRANPRPFTTAVVCCSPLMKPSLSVGFIDLEAYMMKEDSGDEKDSYGKDLPILGPDYMVVYWLVASYNIRETHYYRQPVLLSIQKSSSGYNRYCRLTLKDECRLFTTLTSQWSCGNEEEIFDYTPLVTLVPRTYPTWISVQLLKEVKALGIDQHRVFAKEDEHGNPIIFYKNANSIRQLSKFAADLGPELVRNELVPFLGEENENVDAGLISMIAKKFGTLIPYVGEASAHLLLPPLISLSRLGGSYVLNTAVESFEQIAAHTEERDFDRLFVPFLLEFASSDLPFHRASSCALFHIAYANASNKMKPELVNVYCKLSQDSSPAVRGHLALSLSKFSATFKECTPQAHILEEIFCKLAHDESLLVRQFTAKESRSLMRLFRDNQSIYDVILQFSKDTHPDVRVVAANLFYELCAATDVCNKQLDIIFCMENLLYDSAPIVRETAARELIKFWRLFGPKLQVDILSWIQISSHDPSDHVRAVSSWLATHAFLALRDGRHLKLPQIFMHLIKDKYACVRLNIVSRLQELIQVADPELCDIMIKVAEELANDSSDTAKLGILVYAPMLARLFDGGINKFTEICRQKLGDEYPLVRIAAKKSLKILEGKEKFGFDEDLCFPQDMSKLHHYIHSIH